MDSQVISAFQFSLGFRSNYEPKDPAFGFASRITE
jgi:hypothetical protein